jgi:Tol biopolymer transport system component
MNKKVIILIAVVVVLIAAAAYYFLLGGQDLVVKWLSKSPTPANTSQVNTTPNRPGEQGGLVVLSKRAAISPALSQTGASVWYFDDLGQLYRAKLDGSEDASYGLTGIDAIAQAYWPNAGNDFIVKTSTEGAVPFRYYQSQPAAGQAGKFVDLPGNILELSWLSGGKKIVYVWRKTDGKLELQTADPDAKNFAKLDDLPGFYVIKAPNAGNYVLLAESFSSGAANKVFKFDLETKQMAPLLDRGRNIDLAISPDGTKVLFTRVNESKQLPELWLADLAANTFQNLQITTAISKVAWTAAGDKFYYALPESVPAGDYAIVNPTVDTLYVYDLAANSGTKLEPKGLSNLDMRDLLPADDGSILVFRNGANGRLSRVNLK